MSLNKTIECCIKINCLIEKNNIIFEKIKKQSIKIKYQNKKKNYRYLYSRNYKYNK